MAISYQRKLGDGTIVIDSNTSKVGIGTNDPDKKLQISTNTSGDGGNLLLTNINDTDGDTASILFSMTDTDLYNKAGIYFERVTTQGRGSLHFAVNNQAGSDNVTKADAVITITRNGNVGIGTTDPVTGLDVRTSEYSNTTARFGDSRPVYIINQDPIIGLNAYYDYGWKHGTSGHAAYMGLSGDSGHIYFSTGDGTSKAADASMVPSERMRIEAGGNVGIGTTDPNAKLEVRDSANDIQMRVGALTAGRNPFIRLQGQNVAGDTNVYADIKLDSENQMLLLGDPGTSGGSTTANPIRIDASGRMIINNDAIYTTGGNAQVTIKNTGAGGSPILSAGSSNGELIYFRRLGNGQYQFQTYTNSSNSGVLSLQSYGGNVGIGETSPDTPLHIKKTAAAPVLLTLHNYQSDIIPNGTQGNFIDFRMTDDNNTFTPQVRIGMIVKDTDGDGGILSEGTGNFVVSTGQGTDGAGSGVLNERMRVTDKGRVGINEPNPLEKLHVNGNLRLEDTSTYTPRISFSENTTDKHIIMEYDGSGFGAANYFTIYSDVPGWMTKGSSLNIQPSTGNVGIGTTSPKTKLTVAGDAPNSTLTAGNAVLDVYGTAATGRGDDSSLDILRLHRNNDASPSKASTFAIGLSFHDDPGNNYPRTRADFKTTGRTTDDSDVAQTVMSVVDTGRIGVGTTDPSNRITAHQGGGVRVTGITSGTYIEMSGDLPGYSSNQYPVIKSGGTIHFANNSKYSAYLEGTNTYFGILDSTPTTKVLLHTSGDSYLNGGNVGINTSTPGYKLDVAGTGRFTDSLRLESRAGAGNWRYYPNVLDYAYDGNQGGAVIINTAIPRNSNEMLMIHVKGYGYGGSTTIDFKVVVYPYSGATGQDSQPGAPYNYSIQDNGTDYRPKFIGINDEDNLAIAYGDYDDANKYYYRLTVDYHATRLGTDSYAVGWTTSTSSTDGFGWVDKRNLNAPIKTTINGHTIINSAFTLPNSDGSNGQVLQTNGSGTVSWATVGGGQASSALYAEEIQTTASNTNATRYLTFVDSNNATTAEETLYTTDGIYVNPSTDSIFATGNIVSYASSDRRLKDNLTPIANATEKISKLSGYEFDWNDKQSDFEGHDVGVVAQEVEEVLPEVVTTRKDGYKAVKYEKMVALLIEGMKEQQAEIEALKEEVRKLKG